MASYTILLKDLLATGFEIWDSERPFPIFNEAHRSELQKKIEDHYYMEEIGLETPMLFKHYLNLRMREIMPKYNAMYESVPTFDPNMLTYKGKTTVKGTNTSDRTFTKGSQTNSEDAHTDIEYGFDTPMNTQSITTTSPDHMSSANRTDYGDRGFTDGERTDTDNVSGGNESETNTEGTNQSIFETIKQYREFEFNIDKMIVDELSDLFMQIF